MTIIKKLFYDKHGKLVLYQTPNWQIIGFMFSLAIALFSNNVLRLIAFILASIFLIWWSLLEIVSGVTLFRKLLGILMLVLLLITLLLAI